MDLWLIWIYRWFWTDLNCTKPNPNGSYFDLVFFYAKLETLTLTKASKVRVYVGGLVGVLSLFKLL